MINSISAFKKKKSRGRIMIDRLDMVFVLFALVFAVILDLLGRI